MIARQEGITYVEVLVATVIIAITLVPALESLRLSVLGTNVHEQAAAQHYRLFGRTEELLAESYFVLEKEAIAVGDPTTATGFSDPPATIDRRLVFLSLYDANNADADDDPFTGTDTGLVWLRVEIEGTPLTMASLKSW